MVMIRDLSQSRNSSCARLSRSRPPASSSEVNALMSAPAQNSAGFGEAMIIAFTPPPSIERLDHVRGQRVGGRVVEPQDRDLAARVELDRRGLVALVGLRVRVEPLPALGA